MRTLACDSDVEVIGSAMLSIINNVQGYEIRPILDQHNLTDIDSDTWYPAQKWLDVMNDLAKKPSATTNDVAIGMKIAENVVLPPQLKSATLAQILQSWDTIYQKQHRGKNIGYKEVQKIDDTSYRVILADLYPDDLSYGVAYGFCRRFLPNGSHFTVKYENIHNRRDKGGADTTVLLINWS